MVRDSKASQLSREVFLDLKRLFIGGELREPSPYVLSLPRGPLVDCSGEGVEEHERGSLVDFGPVAAIGEHLRIVRVENLGTDPVTVTLENPHFWLRVRWTESEDDSVELRRLGEAADLEVLFEGDVPQERSLTGTLCLLLQAEGDEPRPHEVVVRLRTLMSVPFGRYDFNGATAPLLHDFGSLDPAESGPEAQPTCSVTVEPVGPMPLQWVLEDLPDWLAFEADGHTRRGPASGRFYEHEAPLRFTLRPIRSFKFLGLRQAKLILRTNDVRPLFQRMEIELSARFESPKAYVYAAPPGTVPLVFPGARTIDVALSNWGSEPANLILEGISGGLEVGSLPVVPRAIGSSPGQEVVQVTVSSRGLPPGDRILHLNLRNEDGFPASLAIPIRVHVAGISIEPARLDFGRLLPGERKAMTLHLQASDGHPLHLEASPRPAVAHALAVSVMADHVRVVCVGSAEPFTYGGPGLEVRDLSSGFVQEIPVKFRTRPALPVGRIAAIVLAVLLLVAFLVAQIWLR